MRALSSVRLTEDELRARVEAGSATPDERDAWQEVDTVAFLLGPSLCRVTFDLAAAAGEFGKELQIAFGWTDAHLHRFVIHGTEYGIAYFGGSGFRDDAREIRLSGFGVRVGERFVYDDDLTEGWRHDL